METSQFDLHEFLNSLSEFGFTYIRIRPKDKRPDGKWSKPEDRIPPDEVISRIAKGGNYGIVPPDGFFIIDFDSDDAYQRSIAKASIIGDTLTFKTPRGYHVVFEGAGIEQGASHTHLGQGVDIRAGNRGYVVGPGSSRPDGRYSYLSGDSILEVPETLRKLLQKPAPAQQASSPAPSPETSPQSPQAPSTDVPEGSRALSLIEAGKAARKHWKALENAEPGTRNDSISKAACGLGSIYGYADQEKRDQIYAKLIEQAERLASNPEEIREYRTTATNQWEKGSESPASRPDGAEAERYRLIFGQFDIQEFEQALANLNISLRNNQETDKIEYRITDDGSWPIPRAFRFVVDEWFEPDDKTSDTIIGNINRYFGKQRGEIVSGITIPDTKFKSWSNTLAAENPCRPFRTWISECSPNSGFEGLTLENWMNPWLTNCESDLNRWISRAIFIGIVQRVCGDKQAYRMIPVLRGEKAIGKTTLVNQLLPEPFHHLFGQFHVTSKTSEMVGALNGKFLCEAGELAGMNDSKTSTFKAFIGNAVNTSRLPYERTYLDYRNTAFIIGTTNPERNVPNDDALRSRLVFVDLQKGPDPMRYLPDRLPHLYALAREAYRTGERVGVLPEQFEAEQFEASEESMIVNESMNDHLDTMDLRRLGDLFLQKHVMIVAGLFSRYSKRGQPGAERAVKAWMKEMGIGTRKQDKVVKDGIRYYVASEEMKRLRAKQIKKWGAMKPEFGYSYDKPSNEISSLEND